MEVVATFTIRYPYATAMKARRSSMWPHTQRDERIQNINEEAFRRTRKHKRSSDGISSLKKRLDALPFSSDIRLNACMPFSLRLLGRLMGH